MPGEPRNIPMEVLIESIAGVVSATGTFVADEQGRAAIRHLIEAHTAAHVPEAVWALLDDLTGNCGCGDDHEPCANCQRIEEFRETYGHRYKPRGEETRPRVVCLCGSTRFMDAFFEEGWRLTLAGEIVLSVGVCKHAEHHGAEALGQDVADRLDELHLRKIDMADYVRVLNVGGYIGSSTRKEIEYAERTGKPVEYLEPEGAPDFLGNADPSGRIQP